MTRMGFSKRYKKQKGGAPSIGIDVDSISNFNPKSIPDLVLWVQADPNLIRTTPIGVYANQQPPLIKLDLLDTYSSRLQEPVITEIRAASDISNSLVRLEFASDMSTTFPILYSPLGERPGLDISAYQETDVQTPMKVTLMTTEPIDISGAYSTFLDGDGVAVVYNTTIDRFLISASDLVKEAPKYETGPKGETVKKPTALLRELLIYGRELDAKEKGLVEGYLAYRGNRQMLLAADHPFMPDMTADTVLAPIMERMTPVYERLQATSANLEADFKRFKETAGTADAVQDEYSRVRAALDAATNGLRSIRQALSKGVLVARAKVAGGPYTLPDVLTAAGFAAGEGGPLTEEKIQAATAAGEAAMEAAKTLLPKFAAAPGIAEARQAALTADEIARERQEAITEEGLRDLQATAKRRETVRAQLELRQELQRLGNTLLNSHVEAFRADLDLCRESFTYQTAQRRRATATLEAALRALRAQFQEGGEATSWTARYPFLDATKTLDGTYRDPTLQRLYEKYGAITAAAEGGDIAYLATQMERAATQTALLCDRWAAMRPLALFKTLYIAHLQQLFEKAEEHYVLWTARVEELAAAIEELQKELSDLGTYKEVSPKPASIQSRTFLPLRPVFYASLRPDDAAFLQGFTHVLTDEGGTPSLSLRATGEMDVSFFIPNEGGTAAAPESGYKDKDGSPIRQEFKQVPANPETPVLGLLPPQRLSKPIDLDLGTAGAAPLEISRDATNTLLRLLGPAGAWAPIVLPNYVVKPNSFYCIQNLTPAPICVRNPGAIEDSVDLLGPGEIGIFLYGEGTSLSSTPGFAYGTIDWIEGLYPYDTLLCAPRSSSAVYVSELKTPIYCVGGLRAPRPLLDASGFFVPAIRADDGNVYDLDDFSRSNPYAVRSLPEMQLAQLEFDRMIQKRQVRLRRPEDPIPTVQDETTGIVLLCSAPDVPAADEFGFAKVAMTPCVWSGDAVKCKGALGDLRLSPGTTTRKNPYRYPEGLSFQRLFRSEFCAAPAGAGSPPVFSTAQGLPILSATGAPILLPAHKATTQTMYMFEEPTGQMNQAFHLPDAAAMPAEPAAAQVPYMPLEARIQDLKGQAAAQQTLFRITNAVAYTKGTVQRLRDSGETVRQLGETITESIRHDISDTIVLVEQRLGEFAQLEGTVERLQRTVQQSPVPLEVITSLKVLELKVRDSMLEIQTITGTIQKAVENYMFLQRRVQSIREFVKRMRAESQEVFSKGYETIQTLFKEFIQRTKSISAPELDSATANLKEKEVAFGAAQEALEKRVAAQPEYLSELREWLLDLQRDAAEQYGKLQDVRHLVGGRLTSALAAAEEAGATTERKELEALQAQYATLRAQIRQIADLYEAGRAPSEIQVDPTGKAGPYLHWKSPSLSVDVAPLLGDAAVQPLLDLGPNVAEAVRSTAALPADADAEALRKSLQELQTRLSRILAGLELANTAYEDAARKFATEQKGAFETQKAQALEIASRLDGQKLAAETAAAATTAQNSEDLDSALSAIRQIAGEFSPDTLRREIQMPPGDNPVLLKKAAAAAAAAIEGGKKAEEEMRRAVETFQMAVRGKTP